MTSAIPKAMIMPLLPPIAPPRTRASTVKKVKRTTVLSVFILLSYLLDRNNDCLNCFINTTLDGRVNTSKPAVRRGSESQHL